MGIKVAEFNTLSDGKGITGTVEPVLGDPWFGRPLVLGDHNHRHGSFLSIKYPA